MVQLQMFVSGVVQGVGFRQFVKYLAKKNGTTGFVRNLPDGRVEAVLQGEKHLLEQMLLRIRKGPVTGKVTSIDVSWKEGETVYPDFRIITT